MEVLLSLGLMVLVLAVAYSCLLLFQNVTVAGRATAERAQLARAIERQMTSDIRCVLYREQEAEVEETEKEGESNAGLAVMNEGVGAADDPGGTTDPESGTAAGGSTESSQTSSSSTSSSTETTTAPDTSTPGAAYASQSMGVFGNATTLVLHVSKPSQDSAAAVGAMSTGATSSSLTNSTGTATSGSSAVPGPISRSSDLRSISYFLAVAGGGGLQGAVGNTATGGTALFATEQGAQGLARLDGDRLLIEQADAAGNNELLAQQAEVLAPEVTQLQFRYFDGVTWVTTWDSVAMNAVPRAIEVTLRIDVENPAQEVSEQQGIATDAAAAGELYRFVVALPLSDPTLGMAL